jgi:ABC-type Fe3+-hydroxamate transport system substrate-binding protein
VSETLRALGVDPVACTRFCEQPDLPAVGGTKNPDVDAIVALAPDLVVVNDEENRIEDADALVAAGMRVHSMSPRSVADVGPAMVALGEEVGADVPAPFRASLWDDWLGAQRGATPSARRRSAVLIWRRPWMTMNDDTYGSSVLELLGVENVFAAAPDRYPEATLEEIAARRPDLVLLPGEPYPFKARHVGEVEAGVPDAHVRLVDGRDLFWWGIRTPAAVSRLRAALVTTGR